MPAVLLELMTSRTSSVGSGAKHEKVYTATGSSDEDDVMSAALSTSPSTYGGTGTSFPFMTRVSAQVDPVMIDDGNEAACRWSVTVTYQKTTSGETGNERVYQFDSTGGTRHLTISKETKEGKGRSGGSAPLYNRIIGVSRDAGGATQIEGVDIVAPAFNFKETVYLSDGTVTATFKKNLATATGTVNASAFRGYNAGEVLFLGANGQKQGYGLWQITYSFAVQQDQSSVAVGPEITFTSVKGWEYVWAQYEDDPTPHPTEKISVKRPVYAYRERVYDTSDFTALFGAD